VTETDIRNSANKVEAIWLNERYIANSVRVKVWNL